MMPQRMSNRPSHYHTKYKDSLSRREQDIIALVASGHTNAEIASRLDIGFETVKTHVSGILGKLGVDSREEAAAYWRSYTSLGGRLGRAWSAVIGVFSTKAAAIAGASAAVVAAAAIAAIAIALSLNSSDSSAPLNAAPAAPEPRVGAAASLPAGAAMPLVQSGDTVFVPTTQGLAFFDTTTRSTQLIPGTAPGPLGASPTGQVWTKGTGPKALVQVDPATRAIARAVELPFPVDGTTFIYASNTAVYVSFWSFDAVVRFSPQSGSVESTVTLNRPKGAVVAGGYLWVALARSDTVARLDPATMEVLGEIPLGTVQESANCGGCVAYVYAAGDSVWAVSTAPGQVTRIDAVSGEVVDTLLLPGKVMPAFATTADGDVWVGVTPPGTLHGELVRIDRDTLKEVERIGLAPGKATLEAVSPTGIVELNGTVWVATAQGGLIPVRAEP